VQNRRHIDGLKFANVRTVYECQRKELTHHSISPIDAILDALKRTGARFLIGSLQRDLCLCLDPSEGRLQLMSGESGERLLSVSRGADAAEETVQCCTDWADFPRHGFCGDRRKIVRCALRKTSGQSLKRQEPTLHTEPDQACKQRQDCQRRQNKPSRHVAHQPVAHGVAIANHDAHTEGLVDHRIDAPLLAIDGIVGKASIQRGKLPLGSAAGTAHECTVQ